MPHGYRKQRDSGGKCVFCKTHKNGEQTEIDIEKIPSSDEWFARVNDEGATEDLGRFTSKAEAKTAAKNWMKRNPKGLQQSGPANGGFIPGMNGAQQSNDFWG